MDNKAGALVFNDSRATLKKDEIDVGQVEGVRGSKTDWASANDYSFERTVGRYHLELTNLLHLRGMESAGATSEQGALLPLVRVLRGRSAVILAHGSIVVLIHLPRIGVSFRIRTSVT